MAIEGNLPKKPGDILDAIANLYEGDRRKSKPKKWFIVRFLPCGSYRILIRLLEPLGMVWRRI
jgi:hypothetical protein